MQGEKQEQELLFFYGSLDDLVPADDPLRRLDALLDLSWLRRETRHRYSDTGRPSVDPVVFAKLLVIAYLHGIRSERELMRQARVNLSYRRFLHYRLDEALPDHSSLTRSRQRLGEETIEKLFEYVLHLCVDAGLVGGDLQSIDSTFVQANASHASLTPRLAAVAAQQFTAQLFNEQQDGGEDDDKPAPPPSKPSSKGRRRVNDTYVSRTDPDSGIYSRSGVRPRLGYLVHYVVDRCQQIITSVRTTGAQERDAPQLLPLVDQVRGRGICVQAVAADRGYSSAEVYHGLAERGIEAYIPPLDHSPERQGLFSREHFTYDAENDRFLCPNGAWLLRAGDGRGDQRYRASEQDCSACPLHSRCTRGKRRSLKINRYDSELTAARQRQKTLAAKRAAIQRKVCSERTFAEAKEEHELRRAHCRGLPNMSIQALMTATVLNLKRYMRAQSRVFPAAAALAATRLTHFLAIRPKFFACFPC